MERRKNFFFSLVTTLFIPPYEIANRHSLHHFGPMCISFALVTPVFLEIASISTSSCLVSRSSRPGKRHTMASLWLALTQIIRKLTSLVGRRLGFSLADV